MRINSEDLNANIPEQEKSYNKEQASSTSSASSQVNSQGGGLQKYSGMLQEVNKILSQLNEMGIDLGQQNSPQAQAQPQPSANTQAMQQESGQEPQQLDKDEAANQAYRQLNQFGQVAEQELGADATIEDMQAWMVEQEQEIKQLIKQQIEGQL